ncbi:hypothetical protein AAG906_018685 [Vitis piasezkii]
MRWLVLLTEFDIDYVTQKSIRGSIVVDHLASLLVSNGRAIDDDFPDEDVAAVTSLSGWRMYFDGAANHSGYGIGVLLISSYGDHIPRSICLEFSDRHQPRTILLSMRLMIQDEWKTRDVKLRPYHSYLELLATLASMIDIPIDAIVPFYLIKSRYAPAYYCLIDDIKPDDGLPLYHDIYHFLRLGVYPEAATAKDKRVLRPRLCRSSDERVWGIDVIGKILPKSSNGHEFILVAINYFTKWVEAASYARLTSVGLASFIRSHIICHYGVPHELISDRGVHFRAEADTL